MEITNLTFFGVPIAVWIPISIVCVVCVVYFWLDYRSRGAEMRKQDLDIIEWEKAWNRAQWEKEQQEKAAFEAENREQIEAEVAKVEARIAASRKLPLPLPSDETPKNDAPVGIVPAQPVPRNNGSN